MFKLEITDGSRTVSAMEYALIPALSSKTSPGVKLKIIGPLQVVNHILMLEPKNLEILGGDVDSLVIVNAYENVLLRALGKPTTETPMMDYNENEVNQDVRRDYSHIVSRPMTASHSNNRQQNVEHELLEGINFEEEDELDLEMLMQIEQQQNNRQTINQNRTEHIVATDAFDDSDSDMLAHVDLDLIEENARRRLEATSGVIEVEDYRPVVGRRIVAEPMEEVIEIDDFSSTVGSRLAPFQTIMIPDAIQATSASSLSRCCPAINDPVPTKVARIQPAKRMMISEDQYEFKTVQGDNILTVDQYNSLTQVNKIRKAYVVFGKVNNVLQNTLRISTKNWYLKADITDDYSHEVLTVKFQTNVNEKLSGVSAKEMYAMKEESARRPQLTDEVKAVRIL